MNEPCPVCKIGKLHRARMRFKNGEEGTFVFCEAPECDYKERKEDENESQVKPGPSEKADILLSQ